MITLEQIRLLESKITRALELIRVLKDENSTLRKGLESAQRRMRELETLVDGFKTDQKEIESVIVRTLHNLDELEESAAASGGILAATGGARPATEGARAATPATPATAGGIQAGGIPAATGAAAATAPSAIQASTDARRAEPHAGAPSPTASAGAPDADAGSPSSKEELDIF